jgi:succinate-acetate transporter protein
VEQLLLCMFIFILLKWWGIVLIEGSGANYYFGGMMLILAGILEFFLGNTFPCVVFSGVYFPIPISKSSTSGGAEVYV